MMSLRSLGWGLACIATITPPLAAQAAPRAMTTDHNARGAPVTVELVGQAPKIKGELIAVSRDTIVVLGDTTLRSIAVGQIKRVRIKRHPFSGGTMLAWGLVGGGVTGIALTAACASVSDGCGDVLPATMLGWLIVTGPSAAVAGPSAYRTFPPEDLQALRAYARFPQGFPPALVPSMLGVP